MFLFYAFGVARELRRASLKAELKLTWQILAYPVNPVILSKTYFCRILTCHLLSKGRRGCAEPA
jgi:hypothetical protein